MLEEFLRRARGDEPVYLAEVRRAFEKEGTRALHLQVTLYDGGVRRFALRLPPCAAADAEAFVAEYVHGTIYNILSSLGAAHMALYADSTDAALCKLIDGLDTVFQVSLPKSARTGYGKCLNVNERTLAALGADRPFGFERHDLKEEPPVLDAPPVTARGGIFSELPAKAAGRLVLGMDIGGTDVKLVAAWDGRLVVFKEYDWFPAGFARAEQLTRPLALLTRLLRAAASLAMGNRGADLDEKSLSKHATDEEMERAAEAMERLAGPALRGFDAIGLCFPDVVIRNRIVGGETYKTRGMRENKDLDYEGQFQKITGLNGILEDYLAPGGAVMNTNDGPMAAFTAAVEQAAAGQDVSHGFFAHTLGTELGTGWVLPDGSIPEIPLEVYNFIIDLGSFDQRRFDADDVRSVNNFSTGLPGTLQKYTCQSGVFRLAAKMLPAAAPKLYAQVLEKGLFAERDGKLLVPTEPVDLRKACLEFFMDKAAEGEPCCREIFRRVGEYLGVTYGETTYVLQPETKERTLFGRLVKNPVCFALLCEGAARIAPEMRQYAADGSLANTPLMRQLEENAHYTVAQFAQAVGAVYYGLSAL